MSEGEKRFDKILGILLCLAIASVGTFGIIKLTNPVSKKIAPSKQTPDSITIECVRCGWINKRSIIELADTTSHLKNYHMPSINIIHIGK